MTNEELAIRIQAGEIECLTLLWEQVERFVIKKATQLAPLLANRGDMDLEDLIQTGYIAVANAAAAYNPESGSFLTLLAYHLKTQFAEATHYRSERQQRETNTVVFSLNQDLLDAEQITLEETIPDPGAAADLEEVEDDIFRAQLQAEMQDILHNMPSDMQELVRRRYWEGESLADIAAAQDKTLSRVWQLERNAINELRKPKYTKRLKPYFNFDYYRGAGLSTFKETGLSIQERYLIKNDQKTHSDLPPSGGNF